MSKDEVDRYLAAMRCTGATWSDAVVIFPVEVLALITERGQIAVHRRDAVG
jgi:hypothetical protein